MKLNEYLKALDKVLMNPNRLLIVSILYLFGPKKESEIVKALNMPWGTFSSHITILEREGYIKRKRIFTRKGYRTFIKLTEEGEENYKKLVKLLREFLKYVREEYDGK